jgi:hypothetical protein
MLFLLLRLLTLPTEQIPPVAIHAPPVVAAARAPAPTAAAALADARAQMAAIEGSPAKIRTFMRGAQTDPYNASCVAQRLAEAQVHVTLARTEMRELTAPDRTADDRAHAARRIALLMQRTRELEHAARLCVDNEVSSISAVKVEVEAPAAVERAGDVTSAPQPPTYCAGTPCAILPRAP